MTKQQLLISSNKFSVSTMNEYWWSKDNELFCGIVNDKRGPILPAGSVAGSPHCLNFQMVSDLHSDNHYIKIPRLLSSFLMVVSHIETSPLICRANQLTGFYMIGTSVMKQLTDFVPMLPLISTLFRILQALKWNWIFVRNRWIALKRCSGKKN